MGKAGWPEWDGRLVRFLCLVVEGRDVHQEKTGGTPIPRCLTGGTPIPRCLTGGTPIPLSPFVLWVFAEQLLFDLRIHVFPERG
jgi:hypothetical protein